MTTVTTRTVEYPADGLTMIGHLALPAGVDRRPAVLLGPEGPGIDDVQRRRADALAELGYVALAFDIHGGRWFTDPQEMLARCMPLLADPDRMRGIGHAALDVLRAEPRTDPDRIAAIGYGTGGAIALELGRDGVELRAIGTVNGLITGRPGEAARIRCPVCGPGSGRKTRSCRPRNGTRSSPRCKPQASTGASWSTAAPCTPSTTRRSTTPRSPASATTHGTHSEPGATSSTFSPSACP
jgi:pimeloyl-ACP methyl ester carboxylesterase